MIGARAPLPGDLGDIGVITRIGQTILILARRLAPLAAALALAVSASAALALSPADVSIYRQAFALAAKDQHDDAVRLAGNAADPLPAKVLLWMKLSAPYGGTFNDITGFLRDNPDWPGTTALRKMAEKCIAESLDEAAMVKWFDQNPPITGDGILFYTESLLRTGQSDRAARVLRDAWASFAFTPTEEQGILTRYAEILRTKDHQAHADRLLWERDAEGAKRFKPLVGDDYAALIDARITLAEGGPDALNALARVPGSLREEPGLLYDAARYLRKNDDDQGAAEILVRAAYTKDRDDKWWAERNLIARRLMDKGDDATAYRVVSQHRPKEGNGNVDADFMSGWLALRLNKPDDALKHFQDLGRGSTSPITRSRAAFWAGRAAEAAGERAAAAKWYNTAVSFGTAFYGQLAASRTGEHAGAVLPSTPSVNTADQAAFERRELVRAARALAQILPREDNRVLVFLRAIGNASKSGADYALAARLARDLGAPDVAIAVAKQAVRDDVYLMDVGYPTIKTAGPEPEPALVHAIIRQESTFNTEIVSPAGARGLMQLMPATARLVAKKLNVKKHTDAKLIADPAYNVRLGSTYLADMIDRFGGSYILAIAAYNAGPQRVGEWMNLYGDPRSPSVDPVEWIERIPFTETRNYVQRVMEALLVYRGRFHGAGAALDLARELSR
jgi:soluble lytic murein transglycosylase